MCPGTVRRFWWRTNQQARLTIACLGLAATLATLAPLATAGAAGVPGDGLAQKKGSAALEAALNRGDAIEVTVYTVSDVDSFEGMEPATGLFFDARVAGLRRIADCWSAGSRTTAQQLLRGKNVWLAVRKDGISGSDGIAVDVRLPNGADYARTVVGEGAAVADLSARGELAEVESAARLERRGLWAAGCSFGDATATASSASQSSAPGPTTTTTTATATTAEPPSTTSPPSISTTSSSSPDDAWINARLGKACLFQGSRTTSPNGQEMVCARNDKGQLRWRRAE